MSGAAVASSRRPMVLERLALPPPWQRRLLAVAALADAVTWPRKSTLGCRRESLFIVRVRSS
jgi:hypothetical protein